MKTFFKVLGIIMAVIVIAAVGGLIYLNTAYPDVDPPKEIKVEQTSQRIERGKYLAYHVTMCMDCHSVRDFSKFSGPITPGTEGQGGDVFDENLGFPGRIAMKNITPAAIGQWSDGEIMRAITCGVAKDGEPMFPVMPYFNYNKLSEEDIYSIVAFIKTLPAKKSTIPERELNFPLNLIVRTIPLKTYTPAPEPDRSNTAAYGKYLVTIAACTDCHTQTNEGEPVQGMEFAGGVVMELPFGTLTSANLTPHNETGIGSWTKEQFINRFKSFDPDSGGYLSVKAGEFNTIMPWSLYAGMTKEDLGAIYDYLKTLKPVRNNVVKFTPPKKALAVK
ncbi:MAG: c-type cytochrome [Ignavibacteriaceae bacterium]